jgi:hypothetical protein
VWWRLVSAGSIIGSNSTFVGNIMSGTSIAMQTGASLSGKALSQAAVTLDQNTITSPVCSSSAAAGSSATSGAGGSSTTPGLPNTGLSKKQTDTSSISAGILVGVLALAAFIARKKYSLVG